MGLAYIKAEIGNLEKPLKDEVELLVDSSAIFSFVPCVFLEGLEIKLADGREIVRDIGYAFFKVGERRRVSPLIFGEGEDKPLLGAVTLEILGYELDPITKKLKPTTLYLA